MVDGFFQRAKLFLQSKELLDVAERLYNIDETWYNDKPIKSMKVVAPRNMKIAYKLYGGRQDHTTLTMCISADGKWLPTMVTFKGCTPQNTEYLDLGPENALYSSSDSGHITSELYLDYIVHLEKFLCRDRPVVIFQDNLSCHDSDGLVEFCLLKGIFLYNLPPKTSHLLQPLDKLFGSLKCKLDEKKQEALMAQQRPLSKHQIPIVLRFAINSIGPVAVRKSFVETGICPMNASAISDDLLVGDSVHTSPNHQSYVQWGAEGVAPQLDLTVYDDNGELVEPEPPSSTSTTAVEPNLTCSVCYSRDAYLHPAVKAGVVSYELASVFIPEAGKCDDNTRKRRLPRSKSTGGCITLESEVERRRLDREEQDKLAEEKAAKEAKRKRKRDEQELFREEQAKAKEVKKIAKKNRDTAEKATKIGKLLKRGMCAHCKTKPPYE